ncbi:hypothetical protein LINPERPRIM_LOCUS24847 [Linum perenne]
MLQLLRGSRGSASEEGLRDTRKTQQEALTSSSSNKLRSH